MFDEKKIMREMEKGFAKVVKGEGVRKAEAQFANHEALLNRTLAEKWDASWGPVPNVTITTKTVKVAGLSGKVEANVDIDSEDQATIDRVKTLLEGLI